MKKIAELDLAGYAIGGLAVGETTQEMYDTIAAVEPYMPADKPRLPDGRRHAGQHHRSLSRAAWTFSTASCPPATRATGTCSRGRA